MMGGTITDNLLRFAKGAADVPIGMARDFMSGASIVNQHPMDALSLLPDLVRNPIHAAMQGSEAIQAESSNPNSNPSSRRDAMIKAIQGIPIIGPMANALGTQAGGGQLPEAAGNLTTNVVLGDLAAKYGGRFGGPEPIEGEIAPATTEATPPPATPAAVLPKAAAKGPAFTPEVVAELRKQLQAAKDAEDAAATAKAAATTPSTPVPPPAKGLTVKLPIGLGNKLPISFELNGPRIAAARAFLSTTAGTAAESAWAQRVLAGLAPSDQAAGSEVTGGAGGQ
jgi:hypothetical protein